MSKPQRKNSTGTKNPHRRNGKAWKRGLPPGIREEEAAAKRAARAARRSPEKAEKRRQKGLTDTLHYVDELQGKSGNDIATVDKLIRKLEKI